MQQVDVLTFALNKANVKFVILAAKYILMLNA